MKHFEAFEIEKMMLEVPEYVTLCDSIVPAAIDREEEMEYSCLFWRDHIHDLRQLSRFAQYAYTITTSSASAERSFSTLKRCFSNGQRLALEDYSMLSCMLQTNRK